MDPANSYYNDLLQQGYPSEQALTWTRNYYPEFMVQQVIQQPQFPTLAPTSQPQFLAQPTVMMLPQPNNQKNLLLILGIVAVIGIAFIVILAGILYVWASDLASSQDIEGTWYNPVDTITFNSDGSMTESTNTLVEWRIDGNGLFMSEGDEYEYYFKYKISGDTLFIAPYDYDLETIIEEDCSAYSSNIEAKDRDTFENTIVVFPTWCNPE